MLSLISQHDLFTFRNDISDHFIISELSSLLNEISNLLTVNLSIIFRFAHSNNVCIKIQQPKCGSASKILSTRKNMSYDYKT